MKPLKYTVAALAILAAASFSSSAMAASTGDLLLGLENSSTSLEFDLGAFSTLTSGETFNLGTNIETTLGNGTLTWDIAGAGTSTSAGGGLAAKEVVFTAVTPGTIANQTPSALYSNIGTETSNFSTGTAVTSGTSSNSTPFTAVSLANSANGSFAFNLAAGGGNYGLGTSNGSALGDTFPDTSVITLYDKKSGAGLTQVSPTVAGTFQFSVDGSGNDILTFDPVATPEPSAYALGLCAVALFFVLRRRSLVA